MLIRNLELIITILEHMEERIDELYKNIEIGGDDYTDLKNWIEIINNVIKDK